MSNDARIIKALRFSDHITCIKCRLGLHDWEAFVDNLQGSDDREVTIVFWVCRHCAESKLKCILPNGHKPT